MKKGLLVLLAAIAVLTVFVGCKKEPEVYTVTFDSQGGTAVEAVKVKAGDKITGVTAPTRGGFDFICWLKDGVTFDLDTDTVKGDMTLIANWAYKTYEMGDEGPAGGIIYYDVDADNGSGNADKLRSAECGWRYLEAAKENLELEDGTDTFAFGYYRTSAAGDNTAIWTDSDERDALTHFGTGKDATAKIVDTMGEKAYSYASGTETTSNYAARVVSLYNGGGYTDWFLPSCDEAVAMLDIPNLDVTTASAFWTSSESTAESSNIAPTSESGNMTASGKNSLRSVRPVRRF